MTADFLEHQRGIGNDLSTPVPAYQFPGLVPGDRWCVTAANWLRAHLDDAAAPVVLASTHERALQIVPLATNTQSTSRQIPAPWRTDRPAYQMQHLDALDFDSPPNFLTPPSLPAPARQWHGQ
jgi:hypothetical protein